VFHKLAILSIAADSRRYYATRVSPHPTDDRSIDHNETSTFHPKRTDCPPIFVARVVSTAKRTLLTSGVDAL
jgi:hypothetical protein